MGCTFGRYRSTGKRWIPRLFYLVIWPMLPPDLPATTKFNRIIKEERAGHAKWRATSTMTDILGYDWMETLQIIRLVDLHGKHNINFSHAATPPRGRGSQRDGHGGNSHCGPFPPSLSLDVNPVFARIFPLDKRDAYEKSLIPWMFIEFRLPVTALFYPWTGFIGIFRLLNIIAIRNFFLNLDQTIFLLREILVKRIFLFFLRTKKGYNDTG